MHIRYTWRNIFWTSLIVFFTLTVAAEDEFYVMQKRKHHGQHAANDGKVCQQPGRAGGRKDAAVHGGKEKGGHASLQHDANVSYFFMLLRFSY